MQQAEPGGSRLGGWYVAGWEAIWAAVISFLLPTESELLSNPLSHFCVSHSPTPITMIKPKECLSPKLMLPIQIVSDSEFRILGLLRRVHADVFSAETVYLSFLGLTLIHPTYSMPWCWGTPWPWPSLVLCFSFVRQRTRGQEHYSLQNPSSHQLYSTQLPSASSSRFLLCVSNF